MSDYKRGKAMVQEWDHYWNIIADYSDSGSTIEAKIVEYQTSIRTAFTSRLEPDIMLTAMPSYLRTTHHVIMDLPIDQREALLVWHFGDDDERRAVFGRTDREPNKMVQIYRIMGRRHRGARRRNS